MKSYLLLMGAWFLLAPVVAQAQQTGGRTVRSFDFTVRYQKVAPDTADTPDSTGQRCLCKKVEVSFLFHPSGALNFYFSVSPLAIWMNDNLEGFTACQGRRCLDSLMTKQDMWFSLFVVEDEKRRFRLYAALPFPGVAGDGSCNEYLVESGSGPDPREIDTGKGILDGGYHPVRLDDIRPHKESKKVRLYYLRKLRKSGWIFTPEPDNILIFKSKFVKISDLE